MHRRENVASNNSSNEASSFPLVDFISKWRLRDRRGQTAPSADASAVASAVALNNQEPLLAAHRSSNSNGDHEVPYPLPDAFLLPQVTFDLPPKSLPTKIFAYQLFTYQIMPPKLKYLPLSNLFPLKFAPQALPPKLCLQNFFPKLCLPEFQKGKNSQKAC